MTNSTDKQFWNLVKDRMPEGQIGNWILLVEVHGPTGTKLKMETSDLMTPWLAEGIINYGAEIVAQLEEEYEVDEDYVPEYDDGED